MAALLTIPELAAWAREPVGYDDPWAQLVIESASELVCTTARQPTWTRETAPARAKQIAGHLAARSFKNPDSIEFEGAVGPLGGDRRSEAVAVALHLTDAERAELERLSPGVAGGGLWVQPMTSGTATAGDVYLRDSSGSDWMIAYLAEGDMQALG